MNWDLDAERELWAHICTQSFWWFFRTAWGIDFNPKARSFTPRIHKPVCDWLDQKGREWIASRREKRPSSKYLALLVPREFWKTTIVGAWLAWLSIKEPSFGTWGVVTGLTGCHPDVLDFDDPISYDRLEKDSGWFDTVNAHVDSLIPVLKADGLMIWPGTRYGDG